MEDSDTMSNWFGNCFNDIERPFYCVMKGQKSRLSVTCLMFGGLISAMVYTFVLTGGSFKQLMIAQGAFVLWVVSFIALSVALRKRFIAISVQSTFILLILMVVLVSNLAVNHDNYDSEEQSFLFAAAHVLGIIAFAFAAQWAARNLQPACILEYMSWMLVPLVILVFAIAWIDDESSRATPFGIHPNWWGEVAFGFILCSLALRNVVVKMIFIAVGVGLMITVQSRGALLAALVSLLVFFFMQYRPFGVVAMKKLVILGVTILGVLMFFMATDLWPVFLNIVESKILLFDDPNRGLTSGLTGRIDGWSEALAIFIENPIFGKGLDTLLNVHNGFLRWAGEGGILLLGFMLLLIVSALVQSWRSRNDWAFAVLLGVIAYMMTYPRALNLNIVGMLFFLALFPWRCVHIREDKDYLAKIPRLQHYSKD